MTNNSAIIVAAAALEQGMTVYRISIDSRVGTNPREGTIACSFNEYIEGQLVLCERDMVFFAGRVQTICEDYEIEEVAECKTLIVQDLEPGYRTATSWKHSKTQARRRVASSQARSAARTMLVESGLEASELFSLEAPKSDNQ